MKNEIAIGLIAVALIIGLLIGYGVGFHDAIEFGLKISKSFVSIEFNEKEIASAIWRYKNQISLCYENAPIFNYSGS